MSSRPFRGSATWANSAAQDTEQTVDITAPTGRVPGQTYLVTVRNPSTVTALTATVQGCVDFAGDGSDVGYPTLTTFAVPVDAGGDEGVVQFAITAFLSDGAGRLVLSNDTVLGASDGFTADVVVERV